MVYRRYGGNAGSIFSMPFFDGSELIQYALDAETDDRLFFRWSLWYQTQMTFEDFKSKAGAGTVPEDDRSAEEILENVRGIIG